MPDWRQTAPATDDAFDMGYGQGYSMGYNYAVEDVIGRLDDEGHDAAADYLRHMLSPEGIAEANERLKALYGSLQALAESARASGPSEGQHD